MSQSLHHCKGPQVMTGLLKSNVKHLATKKKKNEKPWNFICDLIRLQIKQLLPKQVTWLWHNFLSPSLQIYFILLGTFNSSILLNRFWSLLICLALIKGKLNINNNNIAKRSKFLWRMTYVTKIYFLQVQENFPHRTNIMNSS